MCTYIAGKLFFWFANRCVRPSEPQISRMRWAAGSLRHSLQDAEAIKNHGPRHPRWLRMLCFNGPHAYGFKQCFCQAEHRCEFFTSVIWRLSFVFYSAGVVFTIQFFILLLWFLRYSLGDACSYAGLRACGASVLAYYFCYPWVEAFCCRLPWRQLFSFLLP